MLNSIPNSHLLEFLVKSHDPDSLDILHWRLIAAHANKHSVFDGFIFIFVFFVTFSTFNNRKFIIRLII